MHLIPSRFIFLKRKKKQRKTHGGLKCSFNQISTDTSQADTLAAHIRVDRQQQTNCLLGVWGGGPLCRQSCVTSVCRRWHQCSYHYPCMHTGWWYLDAGVQTVLKIWFETAIKTKDFTLKVVLIAKYVADLVLIKSREQRIL